jgi:undecaprenyl-diphosphatase
MTWWEALVLGIVEGVTEYLPVSSTGHLILAAWLLGLHEDPAQWQAAYTFTIVIQAGAIAAVLGLYRARLMQMARGLLGRDLEGRRLAVHLLVAFLPAAVLGPLLDDRIEEYLTGPWPVVGALFVGAWLMLAVAKSRSLNKPLVDSAAGSDGASGDRGASGGGGAGGGEEGQSQAGRSLQDMDWRMAVLIGFGQCIAMWPGTSRSMMTIVAALMLGLRPKDAAEFSFLLGLVTLSAATVFKGAKHGSEMVDQIGWTNIGLGFLAATVSAALAVKWFVAFLNRHGLAPFGWYRLALAIVLALLLWSGILTAP